MSSARIEEQLKKHGYTPGDALTIGPANYATPRLWMGIAAFVAACIGALIDSFALLWGGLVGVGVLTLAHFDKSAPPALRLEAEGIRRGETLIAWSLVRGCERLIVRQQVFIEFTFIDANGREQTQRTLAAPALYRQLLEDNDAEPETPLEVNHEASIARADQSTYRDAPIATVPPTKAPPTSWWRAVVRFFTGKK